MEEVYLSLGSNLGNRRQLLEDAIKRLSQEVGALQRRSSIYETRAWGETNQPDFLNMVVKVQTPLEPHEVLRRCQKIEEGLGRVRTKKWGPRTMDIDILLYGDLEMSTRDLIIPHPLIPQRDFVMMPLREIAPELF